MGDQFWIGIVMMQAGSYLLIMTLLWWRLS